MHEELPDSEEEAHHHDAYFRVFLAVFSSMVASIFYGLVNLFPDLRRLLKSCVPTIVLLAALAVLATYAFATPTLSHSSYMFGRRRTSTIPVTKIPPSLNG